MNGPTWFLIGTATGIAGSAAVMLARALQKAFRDAASDLRATIGDVLNDPALLDEDDHVDDDVWDRDLRRLVADSID